MSRGDRSTLRRNCAHSPIGIAATCEMLRPADGHRERHRLEPAATADRAGHLAHVPLPPLAGGVALGLAVAPLHERHHALEGGVVGPLAAVPVAVADVHLVRVPVQQRGARLRRQPLPGHVRAEAHGVGERVDEPAEVVVRRRAAPRVQRAVVEAARRVRDDELGVDLHPGAQAGAGRARAERAVERERARLELLEAQVVVEAGQVLGERALAVRVVLGEVDEVEHDQSPGQPQRGLHRVGQPASRVRLDLRAGRPRPRSCASPASSAAAARRARRRRRRPWPGCTPWPAARGTARRTRPCGPVPPGPAPGTAHRRRARAPGPRSAAASAGRWACRTPGSAACRCGRTGAAGSRRPR